MTEDSVTWGLTVYIDRSYRYCRGYQPLMKEAVNIPEDYQSIMTEAGGTPDEWKSIITEGYYTPGSSSLSWQRQVILRGTSSPSYQWYRLVIYKWLYMYKQCNFSYIYLSVSSFSNRISIVQLCFTISDFSSVWYMFQS